MGNTVLEATTLQDRKTEISRMGCHEVNEGKIFVIIEGPDDEKIYRYFFNERKVTFYVAGSCLYVVKLLRALAANPDFKDRIIGIKDADFDHILHRDYPDLQNLFLTDYHDIEMTILSKDFEACLKAEYQLSEDTLLVEKVSEDLKCLSYLRLYNEVTVEEQKAKGIELDGINFNNITYSKLYDGENTITWEHCLCHVKSKCNNARLGHFPTTGAIEIFVKSYVGLDLRQLTRGHDLIYALQVRLQKISGHDRWGYDALCLMLRNRCTRETFEATDLYRCLNLWMERRGLYLWKENVA